MNLNWEQKLDALNKLEAAFLYMRAPGEWEVQQDVELKTFNKMKQVSGKGSSPEFAVLAHWSLLTELGAGQSIIARPRQPTRIQVKWNGVMWHETRGGLEAAR